MQRVFTTALVLSWGLWFGAIVMVFVGVTSLFSTFADQRQLAGAAAAGIFRRFEVLELIAAAVAVLSVLALRSSRKTSFPAIALVALLSLAGAGALASRFVLTPRIDGLRRQGVASSSEQFKTLHAASSAVYSSQAAALLAAGLVLPSVLARPRADPA